MTLPGRISPTLRYTIRIALVAIVLLAWSPAIVGRAPISVIQFGTTGVDSANHVAIDSAGAIYVAGTVSGALPDQTHAGLADIFVRKLDATGGEIWTRQFGTSAPDRGNGVALYEPTGGSRQVLVAGELDGRMVVRAYDETGTELQTWQPADAAASRGTAIAVEPNTGDLYAVGDADGHGVVYALDTAGTQKWSYRLDDPVSSVATGVAVSGGHVFVTGWVNGGGTLPGQSSAGSSDAFVLDLLDATSSGNLVAARQFGTAGFDQPQDIAIDPLSSSVLIAGSTNATLPGQVSSGDTDAFVRKYDQFLTEQWTTQFGSPGSDAAQSVTFDAISGDVVVTGHVGSALPGQTSLGGVDAFIQVLEITAGELRANRQIGSAGDDYARTVASDATGTSVIGGQTFGSMTAFMNIGSADAFLAAVPREVTTPSGAPEIFATSNAVVVAAGQTATMTGTGGIPGDGLTFTASVGTVIRNPLGDGTWLWSFVTTNESDTQVVTVTAANNAGQTSSAQFQLTVLGFAPPELTAAATVVRVVPGQTATNVGTYFNAHGGTPTLTASEGTVTRISDPTGAWNATGAWSWSMPTDESFVGTSVTVGAAEPGGPDSWVWFDVVPQVVTMTLGNSGGGTVMEGEPIRFTATVNWANHALPPPSGTVDFYHKGTSVSYGIEIERNVPLVNGTATSQAQTLTTDSELTPNLVTAVFHGAGVSEVVRQNVSVIPSSWQLSQPWSAQAGDRVNAIGSDRVGNTYSTGIWGGVGFLAKHSSAGVLLWARGLSSTEQPTSIAVTADGDEVVIAGSTTGTLPGKTSSGNRDAFVCVIRASGTAQWWDQFGSPADDIAYGLGLDPQGRIVIVGTTSEQLPGQISHGGWDAFARQYQANGTLDWTQQIGSNTTDELHAVAIDGAGRIVATGFTLGALPGEPARGSTPHTLLVQFDAAGRTRWLSQFHESGNNGGTAVTFDDMGALYIAGWTRDPLAGQPPVSGSGRDGFVRKYVSLGVEAWTRQFGTDGDDTVNGMRALVGGIVVAGTGALPGQTSAGGVDVFARSIASDGATREDWQFGSIGNDEGTSVAVNLAGDVLVGGLTAQPLSGQEAAGGFIVRLDPRPVVVTQPEPQAVYPGKTASFAATAFAIPRPSVLWQVSTDGGATFTDIPGSTAATYAVTAAVSQDGSQYRALFTTDAGTTATSAATLTILPDAVAPTVTVGGNIYVMLTSASGAVVNFAASANDDIDGAIPVLCTPASGTTFPVGITWVTCTATDASGNSASSTFKVQVAADLTPPAIAPPAHVTVEASSAAGAVVTYPLPAVTDAIDPAPSIVCSPASGTAFPIGATTVRCTATDLFNNSSTKSFTVTVRDSVAPVLTAPDDFVTEAAGADGAPVSFTVSAVDTIDDAPSVSCSPASGSTFPIGATRVACLGQDAAGNTAVAIFIVTVTDTTPPIVTGDDVVAEATSSAGAAVAFSPSAIDAVDGATAVTCSAEPGANFPFGTTSVTCTSTDAHGNVGSVSFTVTVNDSTPPAIIGSGQGTVEATSDTLIGAGTPVSYSATASDLVDGAVAASCLPAQVILPLHGEATFTCTATDAHGNAGSASFTVTVIDTTPPEVHTTGDATIEAQSGAGAIATYGTFAIDIADLHAPATCAPASGSLFPLGDTTVECTATDSSGNTGTAGLTIHVVDTTAPVITVPAPIAAGSPDAGPVSVDFGSTATDAVDGPTAVTCTPPSGAAFPLGSTTVTCSSTDAHGNIGSATFPVSVIDRTVPVVTTSGDVTVEAGQGYRTAVTFSASATDAHDGALPVTCIPASGFSFGLGTTQVTCTATDPAGNTGSATLEVTVQDTTPPVLVLPSPIAVVAHAADGVIVTYEAIASDLGLDVPVSCEPAAGSLFPIGVTTVNCTATDRPQNSAHAAFTVTVSAPAPVIGAVSGVTAEATSASGATVVFALPSVSDELDPAPAISAAPASGSLFAIGTTTVTVTAINASGLTASASFVVTVADTTPPALSLPSAIVQTSLSAAGTPVGWTATANDLVDGARTVSCTPASGSLFALGATLVQCSASDSRGHIANGSFSVTVINQPPAAVADSADTLQDTPVTIDVLANDTDVDHGTLALVSVSMPANGTAAINAEGTVLYTPAAGFSGTDVFTYGIADGQGGAASATVTVTVAARPLHAFVVMSMNHSRLGAGTTVVSGNIGANTSLANRSRRKTGLGSWLFDLANGRDRHSADDADDKDGDDWRFEVVIGPGVTMQDPASTVVADTVRVQARASVYNVAANELYARHASVLGTRTDAVALPFLTMPAMPAIDAGHQTLTVRRNKTRTVEAGAYGHVRVERGGTLVLAGGLYQLASLDVDAGASVLARAKSTIRIEGDLQTGNQVRIVPDPAVNGLTAASLLFEVRGRQEDRHRWQAPSLWWLLRPARSAVRIGSESVIHANIFAPEGAIAIGGRTEATGAFVGGQVFVGPRVLLTLDSAY